MWKIGTFTNPWSTIVLHQQVVCHHHVGHLLEPIQTFLRCLQAASDLLHLRHWKNTKDEATSSSFTPDYPGSLGKNNRYSYDSYPFISIIHEFIQFHYPYEFHSYDFPGKKSTHSSDIWDFHEVRKPRFPTPASASTSNRHDRAWTNNVFCFWKFSKNEEKSQLSSVLKVFVGDI